MQHQFIWVVLRYRYALANALESGFKISRSYQSNIDINFHTTFTIIDNFSPIKYNLQLAQNIFLPETCTFMIEAIKKEKS